VAIQLVGDLPGSVAESHLNILQPTALLDDDPVRHGVAERVS